MHSFAKVQTKFEQTLVMYATSLSNLQKALRPHTRYSQVSISKQAKLSEQGRNCMDFSYSRRHFFSSKNSHHLRFHHKLNYFRLIKHENSIKRLKKWIKKMDTKNNSIFFFKNSYS